MRIEGSSPWNAVESVKPEFKDGVDKNISRASTDGLDEANLSESATFASRLMQQVSQHPDVRNDRIQSLQRSIADGTYSVSNDQIAGAMIADAQRPSKE